MGSIKKFDYHDTYYSSSNKIRAALEEPANDKNNAQDLEFEEKQKLEQKYFALKNNGAEKRWLPIGCLILIVSYLLHIAIVGLIISVGLYFLIRWKVNTEINQCAEQLGYTPKNILHKPRRFRGFK